MYRPVRYGLTWPLFTAVLVGTVLAGARPAHAKVRVATPAFDALKLDVPGAPSAFYAPPSRKGIQPVLMFLHGRGGNPHEDCRKWARLGSEFGWVVCPQGPEDRGAGSRGWSNDAGAGKHIIDATLSALRTKFKGRVRAHGNILLGFSEGAFIAMQVGVHDASTWSRWFIQAANDQYWALEGLTALKENRAKIKRVYLLTGENDEVARNTVRVNEMVKAAKIPVRYRLEPGLGHEMAVESHRGYRRALAWLNQI